ncbi:glycoside hydrolase [Desulfosarcina alkanivorans]|uniref:Glycoside hydrolase n=1 Tax=Desulfosarcina alkanivorans TaxID=571177 RepID=A0A5K7YGB4_9BACT|nr:glycosyltransferase family 4 protein [Desulfosarcina alkanivorans]BBO67120.1 glycoside hydrolase [Desulfosarcina alkanivorans]
MNRHQHRPLKILHVLSQRPDATGSGIYLQAMLREASDRGHTNFLLAGVPSGWSQRLDGIDDDRCRFVTFSSDAIAYPIAGMSDVMPYESTRFRDLSPDDLKAYETAFARGIRAAAVTFRPDLIHSHHLWILTALGRHLLPDIPMVTTCHGTDLRQFQTCPHLQGQVLAGCRGLDAVMALSAEQKEEIVQRYGLLPEKVHVIGAGYDSRRFVQSTKPDPQPVQLIYAGKLCRAKGVPWLLRALSTIEAPDWHLNLVGGGSGEEQARCLRLAERLGDRVTVYGAVSQPRLAEIMARSHLFVLSSFFEGLPLVMLEALASGCRVVATRLPGVTAVMDGLDTDAIDLVRPPRLRNVDQPLPEDEGRFQADLKQALVRQIIAAGRQPQIDLRPVAERIAAFSWGGIFDRVQAVYDAVGG